MNTFTEFTVLLRYNYMDQASAAVCGQTDRWFLTKQRILSVSKSIKKFRYIIGTGI